MQGVERGQLVVLLLVLLGDAYSITDVDAAGIADAIDGSTKLPSTPIRLPSSTSPAVLIENILKYPPNLRIDPAGKRKVIIKALLFFVVYNDSMPVVLVQRMQATSKLHSHKHTTQNTAWTTGMQIYPQMQQQLLAT